MRIFRVFIIMLLFSFSINAQPRLTAFYNYCTFHSKEIGPYVETYLSVDGRTVKFVKNNNGKFQSSIEIYLMIEQEGKVMFEDKYNLLSQELDDLSKIDFNFLDQQRIVLKDGKYVLTVLIKDKHNDQVQFDAKSEFVLDFPAGNLAMSDIQALENYFPSKEKLIITKSGYDLVPLVSNFYPKEISTLKFYAEIYNSDKVFGESPFLVSYYILNTDNGKRIDESGRSLRANGKELNPVLAEVSLENIPSGNYELIIEVRSRENVLTASQKYFFQRSNSAQKPVSINDSTIAADKDRWVEKYIYVDSLAEHIRSLRPISGSYELIYAENLLKNQGIGPMQNYFYNFWEQRDTSDSELAWMRYYEMVKIVNRDYGTKIIKGYSTDRGRVYLQYGPPNSVASSSFEPSAYPYEIWHYYKVKNFSNKKFVFYSPDQVTNHYSLIHSDLPGEVSNNQWQMIIHRRDTKSRDFDFEKVPEHMGGKADDLFKNPR